MTETKTHYFSAHVEVTMDDRTAYALYIDFDGAVEALDACENLLNEGGCGRARY